MLQFQQHLFRAFSFHKWHHVPCIMTSSIIPSSSILNIWRRVGLTALHFVFEKWEIFTAILKSVISNQDVVCSQSSQSNARQRSCFMEFSFSPFTSYLIKCMALRRLRTLNCIHRLHVSEWDRKYSVNRGFDMESNIRLEPVASGLF